MCTAVLMYVCVGGGAQMSVHSGCEMGEVVQT